MSSEFFRELPVAQVLNRQVQAVSPETLATAADIIADIRQGGSAALREYGLRFGDLGPDDKLLYDREELAAALGRLPAQQQRLLERTAERIATFAAAQRGAMADVDLPILGGRAGVRYLPVARAGCYAPGGRFPLPSSVLMTAVTARTAGVPEVIVASPRPGDVTMAAAAVAGADLVLAAGGAQAIAALAHGVEGLAACDVIVGPGNRYVTAAKQLVAGTVGIDMLAGPSELVVLADETGQADLIAADLLAQAEHDPDAVPILVTTSGELAVAVRLELHDQLADLPTAETARAALANGGVVLARDLDQAIELCNALAPEHLEVQCDRPEEVADRLTCYGALFVGVGTAEVLGDYGAGPNHVLPTGGTARFSGALSVLDFLVGRTWLQMDQGPELAALARDAMDLARLEGLEGHARSAVRRL
jgi:phosphoribosyl-ATP pyrophosphohydrolase/phosphoribosyl-AMP cyclohydrolase/histidinol dehydrogenase